MSNEPNRVQPGVPAGGQFAASQRGEADLGGLPLADGAPADPCYGCGQGPHEPQGAYPDLHVYNPRSEVLATMTRDDYESARKQVEGNYINGIEGISALDTSEQMDRYTEIAEHFEAIARQTADVMEPRAMPGPNETILSADFGRIAEAIECATEARTHAENGGQTWLMSRDNLMNEAKVDAAIAKVLDTRDFTAASGVPFRARIVRRGQSYGKTGSLVAKEDMVFFFDTRYPDHPPMIGNDYEDREKTERNGQHIANYSVSTLRTRLPGSDLNLYGGEPDWRIDADTMDSVMGWMDRRSPLRGNRYADRDDIDELEWAAHGDQNEAAYATRARELTRGWDSSR
jgi:hypothetical protein